MAIEMFNTRPPLSLAALADEFLISVFGYGDYSFKKALSGWEDSGLQTLLAICKDQRVKGLALALYDKNDPRVAIFGPIAVDKAIRNNGIGRGIAAKVLDDLKKIGVKAVYLGIKEGHPARRLYKRLGFQEYSGVVMRKMFAEDDIFDCDYFKADQKVRLREVSWADYPKFQYLFSYPYQMKAFDFQSGYFSSKYVPQRKFLGVFPEMMSKHESGTADVRVLIAGQKEAIVGVSITQKSENQVLKAVNVDFFIHDNFLQFSGLLFESSIQNGAFSAEEIFSKCLISDDVRKEVLMNNNFCLDLEAEMEAPGYGSEIVQTYKFLRDI